MKRKTIAADDGRPITILRPPDPARSIAAGIAALKNNDNSHIDRVTDGPFTFIGWLSTDGCVIDGEGRVCGKLQPGDHFVTFDTPEELEAAILAGGANNKGM